MRYGLLAAALAELMLWCLRALLRAICSAARATRADARHARHALRR